MYLSGIEVRQREVRKVMKDILRGMIAKRRAGIMCGIPSYCTANRLAIEAILEQAKRFDDHILIEATANQVNQFGGYTGMRPADFTKFVYEIADTTGFPREQIVLGGDHLGPLTWAELAEAEAMANAVRLVKEFVLAGFKKIHLDTSMKLADDPADEILSDEVIAERGVVLYEACEEAYQELLEKNPGESRPVFIIGSEVPIPGGAQEEDSVAVTKPEAFERTVRVYEETFARHGIKDAFENIIGVVVQPGVEFADADVFQYDHADARELCGALKRHDGIVFEGHSTDYQTPESLKQMVEDGIAILKVGPALTYGLREGLFALSLMEKELVPEEKRADFINTMEKVMLEEPGNWKKHYHGTDEEKRQARKYSFSDRCRYYMNDERIEASIRKLFWNLDTAGIPMNMLHQYMPQQYSKVLAGGLKKKASALAKDCVVTFVEDYNYATKHNYMISNVFAR